VNFTHPDSYPGYHSAFRQQLQYEIAGKKICKSTSDSIEVPGGSFKVKVSYENGQYKDLGHINSEPFKQGMCSITWMGTEFLSQITTCMLFPTPGKGGGGGGGGGVWRWRERREDEGVIRLLYVHVASGVKGVRYSYHTEYYGMYYGMHYGIHIEILWILHSQQPGGVVSVGSSPKGLEEVLNQ
jgi:hypothetical protein